MVLGPVSFLYQVGDMTLEIVGGVLAVSLTIIGTIYAYKTFKKVLFSFPFAISFNYNDYIYIWYDL